MAFTSAKMSLRVWNLLTDLYDHAQLADNWAKIDYHDHSPGKGVQVPTEGLADGAVTSPKLASTVDPSGAFNTYRTYWRGVANMAVAQASGTYIIYSSGVLANTSAGSAIGMFYIDPADFVNPGRTATMRTEINVGTNAVAPTGGTTFIAGLYGVASISGASGTQPALTLGSLVGSSSAVVGSPPANAVTRAVSSDFPVPTSNIYAFAVVTSAALPAGSAATLECRIAVRAS
jgi:hypothetical protein